MQLVVSFLAFTTLVEQGTNRAAAWKTVYARWADERHIRREVKRLCLLSPHLLDDMGLAHLASPAALSADSLLGAQLPLGRSILPRLPRT